MVRITVLCTLDRSQQQLYTSLAISHEVGAKQISNNHALLLQHSTQVPTNPLNQESLVGKRIRHRWCNPDGTKQWYTGRILSVVPDTTEWLNVQYNGEQEVLSITELIYRCR